MSIKHQISSILYVIFYEFLQNHRLPIFPCLCLFLGIKCFQIFPTAQFFLPSNIKPKSFTSWTPIVLCPRKQECDHFFFALTSNMIKSCVLWRKIDWNFWGLFWSSGWGILHWIFSASKISDVRRSWWKISPLPLLHDSPFQPISFWHRSSFSPPSPWLVTWLNILTSNLAPWNETKVYL